MAGLQPVRGTKDLLPETFRRHRHVEDTAYAVARRFGFEEMATPIFEFTDVFSRTLGETSDVVTKEMYTFQTSGGDSLTLRPEGTAGVARAFMSNSLSHSLPLKYFYRGPMFRHENPQKGRQRQFHQFGVELLGVSQPLADLDVVVLGHEILASLGLAHRVVLEINTLGDTESRLAYREVLLTYLRQHRDGLSEESRDRLERNPLRVLDSKQEEDQEIVADAPRMTDSLNDMSRAFFDQVLNGLERLDIPYLHNPHMVRGLDYYCHTAFEFTTKDLGAQGTVLAGGRYDGLVGQMGGPATPGVGWAAGVERLAMMVDDADIPPAPRMIVIIPIGAEAQDQAAAQCYRLRRAGFSVDMGYSGNLTKRLKRANKVNARAALIMGEDELARGAATLRDLDSGEQEEVSLDGLTEALARFR